MLEKAADEYGEKPAIISSDSRLSFTDLDKQSNRLAHGLIKIGIGKGDRIAMMLSNSLEFIITYFGIVKAGALAAGLHTFRGAWSALEADDVWLPGVGGHFRSDRPQRSAAVAAPRILDLGARGAALLDTGRLVE